MSKSHGRSSPTLKSGNSGQIRSDALQIAQTSPAGLAMTSDKTWTLARHLSVIDEKLMAVAAGDIKRLMLCVPPRHGKSELVSHYFPAWYVGLFPDRRVILTSYEADFAASWGRKARDVLIESGSVFGVRVNQDSAAANRWDIYGHAGGMDTAGVGGPITGKGANVLIIDDPVNTLKRRPQSLCARSSGTGTARLPTLGSNQEAR